MGEASNHFLPTTLLLLSTLPPFLLGLLDWVPLLSLVGTLWAGWKALKTVKKERENFLVEQATLKAQEEAALRERLKDYQLHKEETKERFLGFSQQLERVAEKADSDCRTLNEKFSTVYTLSDKVSTLQLTVTNTDSKVEKLEERINTRLDALYKKVEDDGRWQNSILNEILLNQTGGRRQLPTL